MGQIVKGPSRNEPCPCGSARKYKHCCLRSVAPRVGGVASQGAALRALAGEEFRRGEMLESASLTNDAEAAYRNAISLDNTLVEAHVNLGNLLFVRYRFDEAITHYETALRLQPSFAEVHLNLGLAQYGAGRLQDACANYRRALAAPAIGHAVHHNLGLALRAQGLLTDALASFERALSMQPGMLESEAAVAETLRMMGKAGDALGRYQELSTRFPGDTQWHFAMANCQVDLNEIDAALENFQRVIDLDASNLPARSAIIFCRQYEAFPSGDSSRIAREFGRLVSSTGGQRGGWRCDPKPKRLRIGFVSGDFRSHPVSYFLESVVTNLDANRVHLTAYSNHPLTDAVTERLRGRFDQWRQIHDLPDGIVAERIRDDGIHVLIDLAGHTAGNRLPLFALKPAPVQATWLGYPGTTGLTEIDYFITDRASIDEGTQREYTERLWLLPETRLCFTPPASDLPLDRLAVEDASAPMTFGCFGNSVKISAGVLRAWAEILQRVPESKLLLKSATYYSSDGARHRMHERMENAGLPMERVRIEPAEPRDIYLQAFRRVDLMLDTFPYAGGTTTAEALWMGVPVLTLRGGTVLARQGSAMLGSCGLDEWIAEDIKAYVETAVTMARDVEALRSSRPAYRAALLASAICDAPRFATAFVDAVWGMWNLRLDPNPVMHGAAAPSASLAVMPVGHAP